MEFWGVEVKAGEPIKVVPELGTVVHLSQAVLGESKKAAENVVIYGHIGEKKLVLGHLIPGQIPQLSFDLVFDEEFKLSHNWKNGSVHFAGYQSTMEQEDDELDDYDSSSEEEEEVTESVPVMATENGEDENAKAKNNAVKPESSGKLKVKIEEPIKAGSDEDDSDSDEDDSDDSMEEDDSSDDEDDSEGSDEEDEETPTPKKKPESKKRAQVSGSEKTPVSAKKAKLATGTPQKMDGKKGGHTDTPHPAKKGNTPATEKPKAQTPKSAGGNFSCGTCTKTFGSDGALQSHNKAKHSAGK